MTEQEDIERVRQAIMRFRELLTLMGEKLKDGELAYTQLFSKCTAEDVQRLKPKDLQWQVAEQLIDDLPPLRQSVGQMYYETRTLHREFEELYSIIASAETSDSS